MTTSAMGFCPLCREPATLTDWRPRLIWIGVEGCRCRGYFIRADVLEWRLPTLTTGERADLQASVQGFRAMGREAWILTTDDAVIGRVIIRPERPD